VLTFLLFWLLGDGDGCAESNDVRVQNCRRASTGRCD